VKQDWFETFFQGPAVELWTRIIPPGMTAEEATFLERELALAPSARVLDVPCGNGRHSIELAHRGYRTMGIDLSSEFLAAARKNAPDLDWRTGDMRALELDPGTYDGAFCFGNSFGYLDRGHVRTFLGSLARALKPGARFALDTGMAAESILPTFTRTRWHRTGDLFMLSEARYAAEESRLDIDYTFVQGAAVETRPTSSYVFTVAELRGLLREAGIEPQAMYSSPAGDPYQLGSPRLLLVGQVANLVCSV
jgi:SAM-dependent methyltransferase